MGIFIKQIGEITAPYGSMEGADVLDLVQDSCCFSQEMLDVRSVFADDIRIVPPRFVNPVAVKIDFVGKQPAVEGDKRTKGIG